MGKTRILDGAGFQSFLYDPPTPQPDGCLLMAKTMPLGEIRKYEPVPMSDKLAELAEENRRLREKLNQIMVIIED